MPIWEMSKSAFVPVPGTTLSEAGLKEVEHLQKHLAENIHAIDEDLLVIDSEFTGLASRKRIDLLGVDRDANLVVIELKRDDDAHMDLQALRYAAQISHMTFEQAAERLTARGEADAAGRLVAHFGWGGVDESAFNTKVRVVLVAADFGSELTTAVLWLTTECNVDIRCVRLKPHTLDGRTLLMIEQVLPLPEAAAFHTGLKKKQAAEAQGSEKAALFTRWWTGVLNAAAANDSGHPHSGLSPRGWEWIASGKGLAGPVLAYSVGMKHWHVELRIESGTKKENRRVFDVLVKHRAQVDASFGGTLEWLPQDDAKVCKLQHRCEGAGYQTPDEEWGPIHRAQAEAMIRLDAAVRPILIGEDLPAA